MLAGAFNKTVLTIQTSEEADEDIVFSAYVEDIVSYWKFTNIKITYVTINNSTLYWECYPKGEEFSTIQPPRAYLLCGQILNS